MVYFYITFSSGGKTIQKNNNNQKPTPNAFSHPQFLITSSHFHPVVYVAFSYGNGTVYNLDYCMTLQLSGKR